MLKLSLSILLVLQITNAAPAPDNSAAPMTNLEQLVTSAGETYVDFFRYAVEKYRELFDKVLTISNDDAESDPELKSALMPLIDYISEMNENHDRSRTTLQKLFRECTQIADKYDRGVPVDASNADHKVAKYMNEAEAMKTKFDILMKYVNSLQQFANNVRKYLNSLPEDERKNQKKLRMWYINWQREHEWEKKNDLMLNFFELLDDTKDDREKLTEKVIRNCMVYLNAVVMARQNFFRNVAKEIENEITNPDENAKFVLGILQGYIDRAERMHDLKGQEQLVEMIRLFAAAQEIKLRFKRTDLSEDENKIAQIMNKNREIDIEVREVLLTFGFFEELVKDVEEYLDTRHEEDKEKDDMMKKWFEDVQDEKDLDKKTNRLLSLLGVLGILKDH